MFVRFISKSKFPFVFEGFVVVFWGFSRHGVFLFSYLKIFRYVVVYGCLLCYVCFLGMFFIGFRSTFEG